MISLSSSSKRKRKTRNTWHLEPCIHHIFLCLFLVQGKSEDELLREKEWIDSGRVWLQHRDGFTPARLVPVAEDDEEMLEEGKVRLKLDTTGEIVSVDEDEVVKANPPQFDLAEDLAQLRHLNEASLLHTLRCRYAASLPHTYAGQSLVVINPVSPLAVYSERVRNFHRLPVSYFSYRYFCLTFSQRR